MLITLPFSTPAECSDLLSPSTDFRLAYHVQLGPPHKILPQTYSADLPVKSRGFGSADDAIQTDLGHNGENPVKCRIGPTRVDARACPQFICQYAWSITVGVERADVDHNWIGYMGLRIGRRES